MQIEQRYCRSAGAHMFNSMPGSRWATNINTFAMKRKGGGGGRGGVSPERGRPDAFVVWNGVPIDLECKADLGSLYLGNPDDPEDTRGFHSSQRWWYQHKARPTGTPMWFLVWIHKEHHLPPRVLAKDSMMYLVPAEKWLELEKEAAERGTRTVPLFGKGGFCVADKWNKYALEWTNHMVGYKVPGDHPIRGLIDEQKKSDNIL